MPRILRLSPAALDYLPRFPEGGSRFRAGGLHLFPGRGLNRLLSLGDQLFYLGADGLLEIGAGAPETWGRLPFVPAGFGPNLPGGALFIGQAGTVGLWQPGKGLETRWESGMPGNTFSVLGLEENRLLVQCYAPNRCLQLLEMPSGRVIWQRPETFANLLPVGGRLVGQPSLAPLELCCLELSDGRESWRFKPEPALGELFGLVGEEVWAGSQAGTLFSLTLSDGRPARSIKLRNNRLPLGVITADGCCHLCNGLNYQIIDLPGAEIRSYHELLPGGEAPDTASGNLAVPLSDGRLIFRDDRGRVYLLPADKPAQWECLWKETKVLQLGMASGRLFLLDADRVLRILESF